MSLLSLILIHAISAEAPTIEYNPKYNAYKIASAELLSIDEDVVSKNNDYLINHDVDLNIISMIQLFEARLRSNPKDGDCRNTYNKFGNKVVTKIICNSIGNMQISKGAVNWAKNLNPEKFKNLTVEDLRDRTINTEVGYAILKHFKNTCKSSLPGVWITAFGEGHCPKHNQLDFEGVRRCAVLTAQLNANGTLPPNWKCGHEGKKMKDPTALKFIAKMNEFNNDKLLVENSDK